MVGSLVSTLRDLTITIIMGLEESIRDHIQVSLVAKNVQEDTYIIENNI